MKHLKIENSLTSKEHIVLTIIKAGHPPSLPITIRTDDLLQLFELTVVGDRKNGTVDAHPAGVPGIGITTIHGS